MRSLSTQTGRLDARTPGRHSAEGDDLVRARQFARRAGTQMRLIIDADRDMPLTRDLGDQTPEGRNPEWLCERLGVIQSEAKRARARGVYRSAQDVLQLIQRCNNHMPIDWTRVDGRLFVLNKLLGQYEDGLREVENVAADIPETLAPAAKQPTDVTFDPVDAVARETLTSLLPHASNEERAALTRLMDIDLTVAPAEDLSPDPVPTDPFPVDSFPTDPAAEDPDAAFDAIEWIMPDLVQDLLAVGREYGKILSVSHSLDSVLVRREDLAAVQTRLRESLAGLIAGSLPLQGIGRIDLAASDDGLHVTGTGFAPFDIALPERMTGNVLAFAPEPDLVETPPPPPMITDDTEALLREQLAALMDGGLEAVPQTPPPSRKDPS